MAIFSLHHGNVGKATQTQPGTAGAHVRYITRVGAVSLVMGEHMPTERIAARAWMDEREAADRKNGRVCDKLMLALPVEMDAEQRADLVREFMTEIGGGRVSWLAGIHDRGEDAHNPHVHVILRDKDHETGKRVFGTSEKGSTERLRELWETVANRALERAGIDATIDRRSLAEQGVDREAGIHMGPNVLAMEEKGLRPVSMAQAVENDQGEVVRVINWPKIDQGRTRADRQREIEAANDNRELEREKKGKDGGKTAELVPVAEIEPELATPRVDPPRDPAPEKPLEVRRKINVLDMIRRRDPGLEKPVTSPAPAFEPPAYQPQAYTLNLTMTGMAQSPPREPQRGAARSKPELEGSRVAGPSPEATQQASYEAKKSAGRSKPVETKSPALAEIERGLVAMVTAARERLHGLVDRLEAAWESYREQHMTPRIGTRAPSADTGAAASATPGTRAAPAQAAGRGASAAPFRHGRAGAPEGTAPAEDGKPIAR